MKIHIISIFPESFSSYFSCSIIKNAISKWLLDIKYYKLNDYSLDKNKRVDDKAYWMHGQVISPTPLSRAIEYIFNKIKRRVKVVYLSPRWDLMTQKKLENYYNKLWDEFIIICGHYEGIDERIIDLYVDYHISIWKYVISSGELASMVFIDSLVRFVPWVLWNIDSFNEDSFSDKLEWKREYPIYTRPEEFKGLKVPKVLLSWNHKEIEKWKKDNLK